MYRCRHAHKRSCFINCLLANYLLAVSGAIFLPLLSLLALFDSNEAKRGFLGDRPCNLPLLSRSLFSHRTRFSLAALRPLLAPLNASNYNQTGNSFAKRERRRGRAEKKRSQKASKFNDCSINVAHDCLVAICASASDSFRRRMNMQSAAPLHARIVAV